MVLSLTRASLMILTPTLMTARNKEDTMSEKAIIDLSKINTVEEFHRLLKGMLLFPDYYGGNLDALHDMLTERHRFIVLTNAGSCSEDIKNYLPRLTRVLEDSKNENDEFYYNIYDGNEPSDDEDTSTHD